MQTDRLPETGYLGTPWVVCRRCQMRAREEAEKAAKKLARRSLLDPPLKTNRPHHTSPRGSCLTVAVTIAGTEVPTAVGSPNIPPRVSHAVTRCP